MIAIDTSAIVAIFRKEPEAREFSQAISGDFKPIICAASLLETSIVLRTLRVGPVQQTEQWLDEFINLTGIQVEALNPDRARIARAAHVRFGKGSGHPAGLNYGDCFAYSLAKSFGVPLLFKGRDFAQTDIERVVTSN